MFLSICNFLSNEEYHQVLNRLLSDDPQLHHELVSLRNVSRQAMNELKEFHNSKITEELAQKLSDILSKVPLEGLLRIFHN
jgi:hypothetical protein